MSIPSLSSQRVDFSFHSLFLQGLAVPDHRYQSIPSTRLPLALLPLVASAPSRHRAGIGWGTERDALKRCLHGEVVALDVHGVGERVLMIEGAGGWEWGPRAVLQMFVTVYMGRIGIGIVSSQDRYGGGGLATTKWNGCREMQVCISCVRLLSSG